MEVETPQEVKARELKELSRMVEDLYDNLGEVKSDWEENFINDLVEVTEKIAKGKLQGFSEKQAEKIRELHKKHCKEED